MKKFIFALLVIAMLATMQNANAKVVTHIYKAPKSVKVKYGYTYHRLSTIKCPFFGCRRSFSHK